MIELIFAIAMAAFLVVLLVAAREARDHQRRSDAQVRADRARWDEWQRSATRRERRSARDRARLLERQERQAAVRAQAEREHAARRRRGRNWLVDATRDMRGER